MFVKDYGAPYMIPSFPSLTFPNHWTLVTGLYPSEHGIVGNTFFDPELNRQFVNTDPKLGALDPEFWKGGEPIWETANKQGVKSAIHMWPGSEVPGIGLGNGPTFVDLFNGLELLSSKVDRVMGWLDIEDINERPELILTYVPTIDTIGHRNGIGGEELEHGLLYVDNFMHLMLLELQNRHLDDIVNVIVVSDHGMAPTSNERLLYIDEVIDLNEKIEHIDGWPLFGLRPKDNQRVEDVYNELVINLQKLPESINRHYPVYKVEDLPEKWHFGGKTHEHRFNYRLAPLWIIPDVGYSITTHKQMEENNNDYTPHGVHGYNNTELLMRAIFLGRGPYFDLLLSSSGDGNKKINPFPNTEVYNLICDTLNLSPSPNNGSFQTQSMAQSFAHPNRLISPVNLLHDWTDPLEFPDLPFEVDHIVEDATYDILFKKPPVDRVNPTTVLVSTNTNPLESLNSAATTLATLTEHKPKPLTESNKATPTAEPETEIDPESPEDDQKHHSSWSDLLSGITEDVGSLIGDVSDAFKDIFGSGHSKN